MRWQKYGVLIAPLEKHRWLTSHAAVPVAHHIHGNRFRIYCTGRDELNRSQIGYVELDITQPQDGIQISDTPIVTPGNAGLFDDAGAMSTWLVNHNNLTYLYYIGWNLGVSVPFRNSIGLAISSDGGKTFAKYAQGPILDRNVYDPYFTASCCILIENQRWRMWYLSCTGWDVKQAKPKHYYHIRYAESNDGIHWTPQNIVCIDFKSANEYAISRPSVLKDGDLYKMWYSYRGDAYRIGYAESHDGIVWQRKDEEVGIDVSSSGWDSEMIEYPFVFDHNHKRYMLYNGNNYGKTGIGYAILD